ncbi:unnamed protein product, partial [Pleuronectes platessa]
MSASENKSIHTTEQKIRQDPVWELSPPRELQSQTVGALTTGTAEREERETVQSRERARSRLLVCTGHDTKKKKTPTPQHLTSPPLPSLITPSIRAGVTNSDKSPSRIKFNQHSCFANGR